MRTRATITLTTAAALLALTACSSSNDDKADAPSSSPTAEQPSTTPTPAAAAGLEDAVRAYTEAYFAGKADPAYATLSKRCKGKVAPEVYAAVVEQAHADYGQQTVKTFKADQVSGDLARVSYGVGLPKFDQSGQPWAREGGDWKYDAC